MGVKFSEIITDIIKDFMETNRKEFENSVFQNQLELLKNIKENLEKQN
jgi:predicted methyltransferase